MVNLDGVNVSKYKLSVTDRPPVPTPEQDVEHKEIRGRHGSLTKKYAFKDIEYKLTFNFLEDSAFKQAFRVAKLAFFNAKKLSFDDDPGIYYKIKSLVIDDADNDVEEYGQFEVTFTLDPFAYQETSTQTITAATTLNNPGYESEPYIKAYVAGNGNIYVGGHKIAITNINGTIEIDTALMNAYRVENGLITNLNSHMVGNFPVLPHGQTKISFDGAISKLEIDPRWRWI